MREVWYLSHPMSLYREDAKALAKQAGIRIIDSKFQGDNPQCSFPPNLTLKNNESSFDSLKKEADDLGVKYRKSIGYKTLLARVQKAKG